MQWTSYSNLQCCCFNVFTSWLLVGKGIVILTHRLLRAWACELWLWISMYNLRNDILSFRADCRLAPSQWEMSLQSNAISHWLGANLESAPSFQVNITLKWMSKDLIGGKSTLVQVMAWCRQATSHYLSQFRPRSPDMPQWVKNLIWFPVDTTDDKSTLVHLMGQCHQAANFYMNQRWPRFTLQYVITRPQWVNPINHMHVWTIMWQTYE